MTPCGPTLIIFLRVQMVIFILVHSRRSSTWGREGQVSGRRTGMGKDCNTEMLMLPLWPLWRAGSCIVPVEAHLWALSEARWAM